MKQKSKPIKIKTRTILWAFAKKIITQSSWLIAAAWFAAVMIKLTLSDADVIGVAIAGIFFWICFATHAIIREIREHRTIKIEKIVTELDGAALLEAFSKALDKK